MTTTIVKAPAVELSPEEYAAIRKIIIKKFLVKTAIVAGVAVGGAVLLALASKKSESEEDTTEE